jgi:hypothetical protein
MLYLTFRSLNAIIKAPNTTLILSGKGLRSDRRIHLDKRYTPNYWSPVTTQGLGKKYL